MNLVKTTEELKSYFSNLAKDYKFASLQSFVNDAESEILVPYLGQEIYDVMVSAYNQPGIAGKKAQLLPYMQKAVTHLALLKSADSGSFTISDSGYYVTFSATTKPVSDKKMSEFKKGRREAGYTALEQAMKFLEANIADEDFAAYAGSDAHQLHRAYFINSSTEFTRYYKKVNNSAYLYLQMQDALDFVERTEILPVLGAEYFARLKANLLQGNLSGPEKTLLPYINRALVNFTIAKAVQSLPVEFDGTDLVINSSPAFGNSENVISKTAVKTDQLGQLANDALLTGKTELRSLEDYLVANAGTLTGYTPPDSTDDVDINDPQNPSFFV